MKKYHFRPARLGVFAIYYPATILGWIITIVLISLLLFFFEKADAGSGSISDTLLRFSSWAIIILLIFDLLCFRMGEYPSWWKKRQK